jgi:hypothetical protein
MTDTARYCHWQAQLHCCHACMVSTAIAKMAELAGSHTSLAAIVFLMRLATSGLASTSCAAELSLAVPYRTIQGGAGRA